MSATSTAPRQLSFSDALSQVGGAQKPGHGVPAYTRWVNRRAARYLTAAASHVGATPTQVSVVSLGVTAVALSLFLVLRDTPVLAGVLTAALLALGYALDSADGQLARLQGSSSLRGEWLDHTLDSVRIPAVHLAVAAGSLLQGQTVIAIIAALFSVAASTGFFSQNVGMLLREGARAERVSVRPFQSWILLPVDPAFLYWVFALWAVSSVFTVLYVGLFAITVAHVLVSARRRWRELGGGQR